MKYPWWKPLWRMKMTTVWWTWLSTLRGALVQQSRAGRLHPVFMGSAISGAGVETLLSGIAELLPATGADLEAPPSGTVFKVDRGPAGEKLAYVRMFAGALHNRERLQLRGEDAKITGVEVFASVIGPASATKLARSVVVKGMEALITESLLTARAWGVEKPVLDSLSNLLPAADWNALAEYLIRRSLEHGERRSEEMHEAAATVADAGVQPLMATATAQRQAWAATHAAALDATDLEGILNAIRKAL